MTKEKPYDHIRQILMLDEKARLEASLPHLIPNVEIVADPDKAILCREQDLTASRIAAIFGLNRFLSPSALYAYYAEGVALEPPHGDAAKIGERVEPAVADLICVKFNLKNRRRVPYLRSQKLQLGCSPDFIATDDGRPFVLEIKHTAQQAWGDEPPLQYQIQLQMQMAFLRIPHGAIGALHQGRELKLYRMDYTEEVVRQITARASEFWGNVERKLPPSITNAEAARVAIAISLARGIEKGKIIEIGEEWQDHLNRFSDLGEKLKAVRLVERELKEKQSIISAEIVDLMDDAESAVCGDRMFRATLVKQPEKTIPAGQHRRFSIKNLTEKEKADG